MAMTISSSAFADQAAIPSRYTCQGEDHSPPLSWRDVPASAKSLVLIVDDPDAPDPAAPKMTWVRWVLYNLPAHCAGLCLGAGRHPRVVERVHRVPNLACEPRPRRDR